MLLFNVAEGIEEIVDDDEETGDGVRERSTAINQSARVNMDGRGTSTFSDLSFLNICCYCLIPRKN
jgi:hypothetical protein